MVFFDFLRVHQSLDMIKVIRAGVLELWSTGVLEHRKRLMAFPKQHLFCAIHMCPMLFIITP